MKKYILTPLLLFILSVSLAQEVTLTDSVIYINSKPVALYYKELIASTPRYNMEVFSLAGNLLITAEVIKFNTPVDELKPFFYYELRFTLPADTIALYVEEEAFPLVLSKIIGRYNLISNNKIDDTALNKFKSTYPGITALTAKIKEIEDYLIETRKFNEQVKRDRSKPVKIINEKIIMQDGVKIGYFTEYLNYNVTNQPIYATLVNSDAPDKPKRIIIDYQTQTNIETKIYFANGTEVQYKSSNMGNRSRMKEETGKSLYEISKNKKMSGKSASLLSRACYLIENFAL